MLTNLINWVEMQIGKVHWTARNTMTPVQLDVIRQMLKPNYYVILTRRNNHLSTYFIQLTDLFLRGKIGHYCHAFLNMEDVVQSDQDFQIVEAIGQGVKLSTFAEVFDCQSVVLLKPKSMTVDKWTAVLDKAMSELGKPYDTLFNLKDDNALSCVELVRIALMAEPNYDQDFANFETMIKKYKNLTPQMFYDCPDFEVAYEIRNH